MNIMTILNKLKACNMLSSNEESLTLFSDCFNKFGISLLLLKDEEEFNKIVDLLSDNNIPLQKDNGIYTLRVFAVDYYNLENIINDFKEVDEIDFLRIHPEILSEPKTASIVISNIRDYKQNAINYKNNGNYDLSMLVKNNENNVSNDKDNEINDYLKNFLDDVTLIDRLDNNEENAENYEVTLEIQKVENKICEDYLFPIEDGWGIIINNISVNNFQNVKDNLNKLTKLSVPMSSSDIMKIALMYNAKLSIEDVKAVSDVLGGK